MVSRGREPLRGLTREAGGGVIENQRLGGEPFRRDAGRALPMRRHEGHHGVAAPGLYHQSGHRRLRQCNQPDIQRAVRQSGQRFLRSEDRNLNVDGGMLLAQHLERCGSRCAIAPVDAPSRARPSSPSTCRWISSSACSASASSRRPRSTSTSPIADGLTWPRFRDRSGAPMRCSSSAIWRLTVGGARCSARAASANEHGRQWRPACAGGPG